jgi:phospholipid/cholesterol/gamma-HCH transport system substrate-binding protein
MNRTNLLSRRREPVVLMTATVLAIVLVTGAWVLVQKTLLRPTTITAYFTKAIAIYPGDNVQVAGVTVGHIDSIHPEGTKTRMTLSVDHDVAIPAQAKAVIVAQNLVAARYVELTPAYEPGNGPTLGDGGIIPLERTAVPVEWDQVKDQLMRLSTELGPHGQTSSTSVSRFIDSAADALAGNGDKLRRTLAELSKAARILSGGGGDIVAIITNLETFVSALRDSNTQIVQFQNRFATLTGVLDESRSDLDAALTNLSSTIGDVQRFIAGSRNQTAEQVQRLANVTQNLVDHRTDLENVLHVAPNSIANGYNIYNPDTGSVWGTFVMSPFANPEALICGAIGAVENVTATESGKLCGQYLGPTLRTLSLNGMPVPINPYLSPSAKPENIVYADPALAPGGSGPAPSPPEQPPAISAYSPVPQTATTLPELLLPQPLPTSAPAPPESSGQSPEGPAPGAPGSPPVPPPPLPTPSVGPSPGAPTTANPAS